ncbi:MAG: PTS sugar transporter subunit IIA [Treponema sp.]|jgi:PTS system fructose-specific IIC component/PTS system nitrogen regulatory IIA component|nr:PTS sugar transporter subunit IIA [Treponema sp.]
MLLNEVFPQDLIKVDLDADDKDEAFEELVDVFCSRRNFNRRSEILDSLREREKLMSTGIQKGIAIPHGRMDCLDDLYGMLGISRKGIDYEALDGDPVHLIFMILVPKHSEKHLRVLKRLAELLSNPQFYKDLTMQKDAAGVSVVLKRYEDSLIVQR